MAWSFNREADLPPQRRTIPLTLDEPVAETKFAGATSAFLGLGSGSFMAKSAEVYAKEGYAENVIAFACIRRIADAAASVGLQLQKGKDGELIEAHPVLDLLARPNPLNSISDFVSSAVAWRLIGGEAFITRLPRGTGKPSATPPSELWILEPHRVKVAGGGFGLPTSYEYGTGPDKIVFPVDQLKGRCDLVHLRSFNPLNPTRGLSPMSAAAYSIDTHNAALRWNKALLDNSARPSGALRMAAKDGAAGALADEQFARLKQQIEDTASGPANARKPLLLEGGLEWQEMGLNPQEMDFNDGIWMAAAHVCMAFGVPPQIIGIPGSQTFANFEQASLSFWEDTVLPLLEALLDTLNHWLIPMYGDPTLYLAADRDTITALAPRRTALFEQIDKDNDLSINERRVMKGYDEVEGGDVILVDANKMPLDMVGAELNPEPCPIDDEPAPSDGTEGEGKRRPTAP